MVMKSLFDGMNPLVFPASLRKNTNLCAGNVPENRPGFLTGR